MTILPINTDGYNNYKEFPLIASNIIAFLMVNNEIVWKLLKYSDADAYKNDTNHPNLTLAEKQALIYDGKRVKTSCRVFQGAGLDDAWTEQACILRITPNRIIPVQKVIGNMTVMFELYCHSSVDQLSNEQTRLNMITQQIIELFNGQTIGGIGEIYFVKLKYNNDAEMMAGVASLPFRANKILMCNWVT